jgi:DNA-binding HxlR family transcriptional regulator
VNRLKLEWDPYQQNCPTRMVLNRIADKWAVLILGVLQDEPTRFNQLRREIEGVSQKVLSQTLRKLERDGLVLRTVIPTTPVAVEYAITPLGRTLASTVEAIRAWSEAHIEDVLEAQKQFDAKLEASPY